MHPKPDTPTGAVQGLPPEAAGSLPASQLPTAISPMIQRCQEAFRRDLPELLRMKSRNRQWVAYHGDKRIGFGRTKTELYQQCLRAGLRRGEFVVRAIEPEPPDEVEILKDV
jgi:hypothetical protein